MKIGLIIPANIKYSPYVQYYIQNFKKEEIDYVTIVWNKKNINENADYIYDYPCKDTNRKKILIGHYKFAKKCKEIIRKENLDKLIIFTIAPAFFLGRHYLKKYRNNFILDIRDDSPFRRKFPNELKKICEIAFSVVVSSNNFAPWTGRDIILCHNTDVKIIKKYFDVKIHKKTNKPLSIVFAGSMIEPDINIKVLSKLQNNPNYKLGFIGHNNIGKEKIIEYANKNNIHNVWFEGTFQKEEIVCKYQSCADLINIFRRNTIVNKNALPNKMYDAIISAIPLIVFEHNEAICRYVKEYNLGIILQEKDMCNLENIIIEKFEEFNYKKFGAGRILFLRKVLRDMSLFSDALSKFVKEERTL